MAEKLEQGQLFKSEDITYLVIGARESCYVDADRRSVSGWLVTIAPFNGEDPHGFALLGTTEDVFQFTSAGDAGRVLGEIELLDDIYKHTFGWRKS